MAAQRAVTRSPLSPLAYRYSAASLGQLGRVDEARDVLEKAIQLSPGSFDLYVRSCPPWFRPEYYEHVLEGLQKAGLQGHIREPASSELPPKVNANGNSVMRG